MGGYGEGGYGNGPFGIGEDFTAFVKSTILERFPEIFPREHSSVFHRYVEAHDDEMTAFDADIQQAIASHQVDQASGKELDRIGSIFGELGRRRGRTDTVYRSYLKSIVQSFSGRGTVPGIKFAIAGGVNTTTDKVEVIEHFNTLENTLVLKDWDTHTNETVITLFNLAKPSVVQLRDIIIYGLLGGKFELKCQAKAGNTDAGLGSGTIGDNNIGFYE